MPGHKLVQHGAVRLWHGGMQQCGGGDHQYTRRLGVVGRVNVQAEVAVRHPAGLQDLAVRVGAKLRHSPYSCCWWMVGTRLPGRGGR